MSKRKQYASMRRDTKYYDVTIDVFQNPNFKNTIAIVTHFKILLKMNL